MDMSVEDVIRGEKRARFINMEKDIRVAMSRCFLLNVEAMDSRILYTAFLFPFDDVKIIPLEPFGEGTVNPVGQDPFPPLSGHL